MLKNCEECGTVFDVDTSKRNWQSVKLCSADCQKVRDTRKKREKYIPQEWPQKVNCEWCGEEIIISGPGGRPLKFCSKICINAKNSQESAIVAESKRTSRVCPVCGKAFLPSKYNHGKQTYCSHKCYFKVARSNDKGAINRYADQTEFFRARNVVLKRDGKKCVYCGKDGKMQVHHKDNSGSFDKPNNHPDNLITLCKDCHHAFHNIAIIPHDDGWAVTGKIFEIIGIKGTVRIV